jgi:2,4-diaminopentanoate dehydrogenase
MFDFSPLGPQAQKIKCLNCTREDFSKKVKSNELPLHIGLVESIYLIADALNWKLKVTEKRIPVIAKKDIRVTNYGKVKRGMTAGYNHIGYGTDIKGKTRILLEEKGRVDPKINYNLNIEIKGTPKLQMEMNVPPTTQTTTSHAVNLIPLVIKANPGLITMKDLPIAYPLKNKLS